MKIDDFSIQKKKVEFKDLSQKNWIFSCRWLKILDKKKFKCLLVDEFWTYFTTQKKTKKSVSRRRRTDAASELKLTGARPFT